jgi:hypothetical protein
LIWFFFEFNFFIELKCELEQRYTALEELQKNGNKYDQQEVEKELEILEKLQYKYNKIEVKRKKLAKQNYEQVKKKLIWFFLRTDNQLFFF